MKIKRLSNVRFFLAPNQTKDALPEICSLANDNGGTIYFGIREDGTVVGCEIYAHTIAEVDELINHKIKPKVPVQIFQQKIDGRNVLAIRVNSYSTKKISISDPRYKMVDDMQNEIPKKEIVYEEIEMASLVNVDIYRIKWFLTVTRRISSPDLITKKQIQVFLKESNLLSANNLIAPGMLLFSEDSTIQFPFAYILCSVLGTKSKVIDDEIRIRGSLFKQVEFASDFIFYHLHLKTSADVEAKHHLPFSVLHKLVSYMIMYRDYSINQASQIKISSNSLKLLIPGVNLAQFSEKDVDLPNSNYQWDQIIYLMKQAGYLPEKQFNLDILNSWLKENNLKPAVCTETSKYLEVKIFLTFQKNLKPVRRRDKDVGNRKKQMLKVLVSNPEITIDEISDKLKLSKATVKLYSLQLQKVGKIIRKGSKRRGRWEIV